eukprot:COSAG03_NODE_151_length_11504_cov_23.518632_9_plen_92_part_00
MALEYVTTQFQEFEKKCNEGRSKKSPDFDAQQRAKPRPTIETFRGWLIAGWMRNLPKERESMSYAERKIVAHVENDGADLTPANSWFMGIY